jgi:hypothetical protein
MVYPGTLFIGDSGAFLWKWGSNSSTGWPELRANCRALIGVPSQTLPLG